MWNDFLGHVLKEIGVAECVYFGERSSPPPVGGSVEIELLCYSVKNWDQGGRFFSHKPRVFGWCVGSVYCGASEDCEQEVCVACRCTCEELQTVVDACLQVMMQAYQDKSNLEANGTRWTKNALSKCVQTLKMRAQTEDGGKLHTLLEKVSVNSMGVEDMYILYGRKPNNQSIKYKGLAPKPGMDGITTVAVRDDGKRPYCWSFMLGCMLKDFRLIDSARVAENCDNSLTNVNWSILKATVLDYDQGGRVYSPEKGLGWTVKTVHGSGAHMYAQRVHIFCRCSAEELQALVDECMPVMARVWSDKANRDGTQLWAKNAVDKCRFVMQERIAQSAELKSIVNKCQIAPPFGAMGAGVGGYGR
eukprot:GDKI01004082.1.p1 GENE.GDKI01004082.1~~GDKI01004082.1.p1  ORF type:complete len:395 (+),score=112.24 GDKI01004082.1:103-1185(+)